MFVWSLSRNTGSDAKRYNISLHSDLRHISASRFEVGMITTTNEILLWDVESGLRKIDTSTTNKDLLQNNPHAFGLVIHPTKPKHLFIFYRVRTANNSGPYMPMLSRRVFVQGMRLKLSHFPHRYSPRL
jgi:hypothetical protein